MKILTLAIKPGALVSQETFSQQLSQKAPTPASLTDTDLPLLGKRTVKEGLHKGVKEEAEERLHCQKSSFLPSPAQKVSQFIYSNQDQKSWRRTQMKKGINFKCQLMLTYISTNPISALLFYCGTIKL